MNLENNLGDQRSKRKPGALKGKICTSDDCWETNDEIIQAIEKSEIFPTVHVDKNQTDMTGKQFVEKWRGVIKDVEVNNLSEFYLNEKYK